MFKNQFWTENIPLGSDLKLMCFDYVIKGMHTLDLIHANSDILKCLNL